MYFKFVAPFCVWLSGSFIHNRLLLLFVFDYVVASFTTVKEKYQTLLLQQINQDMEFIFIPIGFVDPLHQSTGARDVTCHNLLARYVDFLLQIRLWLLAVKPVDVKHKK